MLFALNEHFASDTLRHQIAFANELAGRKVRQEGFTDLGKAINTRPRMI